MNAYFAICLTLFVALALSVAQGVTWLSSIMPPWSLLMLVFWCVFGSHSLGIFSAALIGLLQDSITGTVLGLHMLSYALVMALVMSQSQRLKLYSFWQQSGAVFLILLFVQLIQYVFISLHSNVTNGFLITLLPAVTGALLWPMIVYSTLRLFRYFGVFHRVI